MSATQALLWALVIAACCVAGGMLVGFIVAALRERAYQRDLERQYAQEWQRLHRAHQDLGRFAARDDKPNRYLTDTDGAPE